MGVPEREFVAIESDGQNLNMDLRGRMMLVETSAYTIGFRLCKAFQLKGLQ